MTDRDADFAAYLEARQPRLLGIAYLLTGNRHQAEDLLQTSLAKLYLSWDNVRDRGNVDAYVRRIMVNENNSLWRRAWRRREVPTDEVPDVTAGPRPARRGRRRRRLGGRPDPAAQGPGRRRAPLLRAALGGGDRRAARHLGRHGEVPVQPRAGHAARTDTRRAGPRTPTHEQRTSDDRGHLHPRAGAPGRRRARRAALLPRRPRQGALDPAPAPGAAAGAARPSSRSPRIVVPMSLAGGRTAPEPRRPDPAPPAPRCADRRPAARCCTTACSPAPTAARCRSTSTRPDVQQVGVLTDGRIVVAEPEAVRRPGLRRRRRARERARRGAQRDHHERGRHAWSPGSTRTTGSSCSRAASRSPRRSTGASRCPASASAASTRCSARTARTAAARCWAATGDHHDRACSRGRRAGRGPRDQRAAAGRRGQRGRHAVGGHASPPTTDEQFGCSGTLRPRRRRRAGPRLRRDPVVVLPRRRAPDQRPRRQPDVGLRRDPRRGPGLVRSYEPRQDGDVVIDWGWADSETPARRRGRAGRPTPDWSVVRVPVDGGEPEVVAGPVARPRPRARPSLRPVRLRAVPRFRRGGDRGTDQPEQPGRDRGVRRGGHRRHDPAVGGRDDLRPDHRLLRRLRLHALLLRHRQLDRGRLDRRADPARPRRRRPRALAPPLDVHHPRRRVRRGGHVRGSSSPRSATRKVR